MGDDSDGLFSRDEVLAGASGRAADTRRAQAIVYLIEQEARRSADRRSGLAAAGAAASAMAGSPIDPDDLLDPEARRGELPGEADEAFIESFRAARRGASSPELKLLEKQTDAWGMLVPSRVDLRIRVLDLLSRRYELTTRNARRILEAFGADQAGFVDRFAQITGRPLAEAVPEAQGVLGGLFGRKRKG
jgi:hypothetical protein